MKHKVNRSSLIGIITLFCCLILLPAACKDGGGHDSPAESRPFYMGFSPWAYEESYEAMDWIYEKLGTDGDIISHHMEEGVPWQEALDGSAFSTSYQNEIESRISRKKQGQKFLLQINPLNNSRDGKALYRDDNINSPLTAPWDSYALDSSQVKTAFLNYAKRMIEYFDPDFLLIGVEVNLLVRNNYSIWSEYLNLHEYVYTELKEEYPDLPISASVFCVPFFDEWSDEDDTDLQIQALNQLEPYLDYVSFSIHPFMSELLCEEFPDNYMNRLYSITDKPVAVAESSYSAQVWNTTSPPLTFNGSQEKQNYFTKQMLSESYDRDALYVIWFAIRDYDALWKDTLGSSEESLVWRDTGLYDEDGNPRLAHDTWINYLEKEYKP